MQEGYESVNVKREIKQKLVESSRGKETFSERVDRALKAEKELEELKAKLPTPKVRA